MIFTEEQQATNRDAFIKECRHSAWAAACQSDYIAKSFDELAAEYAKLKKQDDELAEEIKKSEQALDTHTVENRQNRKALQEQRNSLARGLEFLSASMKEGQQAMQTLLQKVEMHTAHAKHAETWKWPENATIPKAALN